MVGSEWIYQCNFGGGWGRYSLRSRDSSDYFDQPDIYARLERENKMQAVSLSPLQFMFAFGVFMVLVIAVFGGVPMIRRSDERGNVAVLDMRAVLVLFTRANSPFMASGGNLFRVTMYNDFLLITFLAQQKVAYKEIDAVDLITNYLPEVRLTVGKVRVRIFGRKKTLEMLCSALKIATKGR